MTFKLSALFSLSVYNIVIYSYLPTVLPKCQRKRSSVSGYWTRNYTWDCACLYLLRRQPHSWRRSNLLSQ